MRHGYEFTFTEIASNAVTGRDTTLALLGSQGWEIRGIVAQSNGTSFVVALQRPLDEEHPLPEREALVATLEAPLVAPGPEEFDIV